MRLYIALPTEAARLFIDRGFIGRPRVMYEGHVTAADIEAGAESTGVAEYVEFRDIPPTGLTFSRTTETNVASTDEGLKVTVSGGPMLADDLGDFILSIEVPDEVAREHEVTEDPPMGWPFREVWLPPEVANTYRHTLKVFDSNDGEEVRPDLIGR